MREQRVPTLGSQSSYYEDSLLIRKPWSDKEKTPKKYVGKELAMGTTYGLAWGIIATYRIYKAMAYMLRSNGDEPQTPKEETKTLPPRK